MLELARVWQLTPTQKNLVPRFRILREEGGVLESKTILPFPSGFFLGMVWPLNLEKLDIMVSSGTLGFDQGYERDIPDMRRYLVDQAFRGPLHG